MVGGKTPKTDYSGDVKATTGILFSPNWFYHFPQLSFRFPRLIAQMNDIKSCYNKTSKDEEIKCPRKLT
jgi:hypothetical protein